MNNKVKVNWQELIEILATSPFWGFLSINEKFDLLTINKNYLIKKGLYNNHLTATQKVFAYNLGS